MYDTSISRSFGSSTLRVSDSGLGEPDNTFRSMFDNMHHLESVRLDSTYNCMTGDGMIATLANQNPKLGNVSVE